MMSETSLLILISFLFVIALLFGLRDTIQKMVGATPGSIVRLIASDLKYTVCASIVAGLGLSFLQGRHWLERFAVKVPLSLWIYIVCGIAVAGLICAITVLKIRKTANENPVNSIKKE